METVKLLAEGKVVTLEARPFTLVSGSELPQINHEGELVYHLVGLKLEGTGRALKKGRVFLDFTLSHTKADKSVEGRVLLNTGSAKSIGAFPAGEVIKLCLPKKGEAQVWAEILVTVQDR